MNKKQRMYELKAGMYSEGFVIKFDIRNELGEQLKFNLEKRDLERIIKDLEKTAKNFGVVLERGRKTEKELKERMENKKR